MCEQLKGEGFHCHTGFVLPITDSRASQLFPSHKLLIYGLNEKRDEAFASTVSTVREDKVLSKKVNRVELYLFPSIE